MNWSKPIPWPVAAAVLTGVGLTVAWLALQPGSGQEIPEVPRLSADPERPNGFDLSNAIIPRDEIVRGGPARDGIPAIDRPVFVPADRADFLRDDDLVVGVRFGGEARAYPLRILVWHEIVNDVVAGRAVAVTYCPLCGTSMVFDRTVDGRRLDFGVSGLLYHSDVLLYDRQTESLWSQLAARSVTGPSAGTDLEWLPSEHMTWKSWKGRNPRGLVLSTDTGHSRDYAHAPYQGYEQTPQIIFPVPRTRDELPPKDWVLGVRLNGEAKAYPVDKLPAGRPVTDTVGGKAIRISYDPGARHPQVVDAARGEPVPSVLSYWFAWQAFYPQTGLWAP